MVLTDHRLEKSTGQRFGFCATSNQKPVTDRHVMTSGTFSSLPSKENSFFYFSGLVLELDKHKDECATKYLTYKERYILVEKRVTSPSEDSGERSPTRDVTYVPLLQRLTDNFPQYEARLAQRSPSQLQHSTASRGSTGRSKKVRVKHRKSSQVLERD